MVAFGLAVLLATATLAAPPAPPTAKTPPFSPSEGGKGAGGIGGTSPTYCVAFSPDGKRLAVGGYKRVSVYDTESGKRVLQFVAGADAVRALAWSPDGKRIAAGSGVPAMGGTVIVVDAATGKPTRTLDKHADTVESLAFSGNTILSAADDETVAIDDLATGKTVGTLREHVGRCLSVVVPGKTSADDGGAIFVTGGADNMVKVWDADKRRVVVNFDQATAPVWSVAAFNRAGRFVAASADGHLRWHNVRTETERQLPNGDKEPIVPPNGEPQPRSGYIERDIMAHEGGAYSVATSPTDAFLVSGGADGKVIVWRNDGNKVREWTDSERDITGVAVSADGKRIASASLDGVVRVYDAEKGAAMWRFPLPTPDAVGTGTGLTATYWNNTKMEGAPLLSRVEGGVDFVLTGDAPIPGVPKEQVSARFEGFFEAPAGGKYTFITRADDGVRLFVEGKAVIDAWTDRGTTEDRTKEPIALKKGQRVAIRLEYYQGGGSGEIHLLAERKGKPAQTIAKGQLHPVKKP
ncbi:MAG: PQQ-binding-like beta-propeller repeat protein [Armatimonadetes bacterium]|nr:PQQ-binding-like beta-propeller repeat protein [Armatimonadota bacterium]